MQLDRYNGYLKPHLETIVEMADRGASCTAIAEALFQQGVRTSSSWSHHNTLEGSIRNVLARIKHPRSGKMGGSYPRSSEFDGQMITARAHTVLTTSFEFTTWQQVAAISDRELLRTPNLGPLTVKEIRVAQHAALSPDNAAERYIAAWEAEADRLDEAARYIAAWEHQ